MPKNTELTQGDLEDYEDATGLRAVDLLNALAATFNKMQRQQAEQAAAGIAVEDMELDSIPDVPIKALRGLAYVTLRKVDPTVTYESLREMSFEDMANVLTTADIAGPDLTADPKSEPSTSTGPDSGTPSGTPPPGET